MEIKYDFVFITNVPAFYKINLFNKIAERLSIKVIFLSRSSDIRNSDFVKGEILFEHEFISDNSFEKRNKWLTFKNVLKSISNLNYKYLVYPGWEIRELIPLMLTLKKSSNAIVIESSILETKTTGIVWTLKKLILNNMSLAFPSGELQGKILEKADYKGDVSITHGVGLINSYQSLSRQHNNRALKYLYVGRLSQEKNLTVLVEEFKKNKKELTIVGDGPLERVLREGTPQNIKFLGYVDNHKLRDIYLEHDVFILPSFSEPWGLVIDEALSYQLPVIVSSNVGCKDDLVITPKTGCVFDLNEGSDLARKIEVMENSFDEYLKNVRSLSYESRIITQIESYTYYEKNINKRF